MDKQCAVKGCARKYHAKGYCCKHLHHIQRHGRILNRTNFDKQEYVQCDGYMEICIYRGENLFCKVKIDNEDCENIRRYKWYTNNSGYVNCKDNNFHLSLHRFILNVPDGYVVDHINHDPLDNRKCNLRICMQFENMHNIGKVRDSNKSGVPGVCIFNQNNKWRAYLSINSKQIHLGYYNIIEDAIKAREEGEVKYYGKAL